MPRSPPDGEVKIVATAPSSPRSGTVTRVANSEPGAIEQQAGHRAIARAMHYADHSEVELERLQSERALEKKRGGV